MKPRYIFHAVSLTVMPWLMGGANAHWGEWPAWVFAGYWAGLGVTNVVLLVNADIGRIE